VPQPDVESLACEVQDLARRVASIEARMRLAEVRVEPEKTIESAPFEELPPIADSHPLERAAAVLPVFGRALLGVAGAYLLRAVNEGDVLPGRAGIGAGIVYAGSWLMWAASVPPQQALGAAVYSLTGAVILAPLVWEATVRLHALAAPAAGVTLFLFAAFAMAVSWRKNQKVVSTIATVAALGTGIALLIGTHDVLPLTFLFLAIAAAVEASACLDHWLNERWMAAVTADLSVWLATWLVTKDSGLPETYAAIPHLWLFAAQVALLAIYLASTIVRTLLRGFSFTAFETAQVSFAFLISVRGGLSLSRIDSRLAPFMAILVLVCGAACYLVSFARLEQRGHSGRNFYTYSTFGILLALAGSRILLPEIAVVGLWSVLALASLWAGGRFGRLTLQVHGGVYLLLALTLSGALQQAAKFLLGSAVWPGDKAGALIVGTSAAALGYAVAIRYRGAGTDSRGFETLRLLVAAAFFALLTGALAGGLTGMQHAIAGTDAGQAYCATVRTGVIVIAAVLLAWFGRRWDRREFTRLVYPAMALGGYRLLAQDLHQDRKLALFFSLLLYGATLTMLPRLRRTVR